jgi:hypothetical protein
MSRTIRTLTLACAVVVGTLLTSAHAAEREQVRMVINLLSSVKMPFPRNLQNNLSRTERVQLDTNGATAACVGQVVLRARCTCRCASRDAAHHVSQWLACWSVNSTTMLMTSIDGSVDIGSTTRLDGQPHAPVGVVSQFFFRGINRGEQFRSDYQKLYDEGIQVALKYLGE